MHPNRIPCATAFSAAFGALLLLHAMDSPAEPNIEKRKTLAQQTLSSLDEKDTMAVIETLLNNDDPILAVTVCGDLMNHFYWKQKNISQSLQFARAGLQHGLVHSPTLEKTDPESAAELRSTAKGLAYDIASFTWPGWNEEGITLTDDQIDEGHQAARTNLRLAQELNKSALPLSRAHWMLAAHEMSAGKYEAAITAFQKAAELAGEADAKGEALLAEGFEIAILVLQNKDGARKKLDLHLEGLKKVKDGEFFAGQINTALQIFSSK